MSLSSKRANSATSVRRDPRWYNTLFVRVRRLVQLLSGANFADQIRLWWISLQSSSQPIDLVEKLKMWLRALFYLFASTTAESLDRNALSARNPALDPLDFSWITKWAAVGDSFTAGIGSGNVLSSRKADRSCSRYDYSYPVIMNQFFGGSVDSFTYSACSGATSIDIASQIEDLPMGLDLAVMTAGGNDLCLVGQIPTKTCI